MAGDWKTKAKPSRFALPLASACLAALYVLALHPASGQAGGALFVLTGWAIPSLIPVLLALWAARAFRRSAVRAAVFAAVLVVASANTRLPALFAQAFAHPDSEWQVDRPMARSTSYEFYRDDRAGSLALERPPLSRVSWHASTRCMCLTLSINDAATYEGALEQAFGEYGLMRAWEKPSRSPYVSYAVTPDSDGAHATVAVQFHDSKGAAAAFRQRGVPLAVLPALGGDGLEGADALPHALDLLLHGSLWLELMSSAIPNYFDAKGFAAFRDKATPAQ